MARLLLRADDLDEALAAVAHRIATTLELPSAAIELGAVERRRDGSPSRCARVPRQLGTLLVPADLPEATLRAPAGARRALARGAAGGGASSATQLLSNRVEAAALRRTDVLKTALLRAVSHDLRSPLTAILNAAGPLQSDSITRRGARRAGRA